MATAKRPARGNKKPAGIKVDFSDTESQGVIDEGDVGLEVVEVEQKTSDNSGGEYLALEFKIIGGLDDQFNGRKVYHNCSLQPQALFNLRGVLEALGFEVPQGVMDLDPADMIGETCGASLAHEVYQGKTKARPVEFFPIEELESRGEEPAAPAASTKVVKKGATKPAAEPEAPAATGPKKKVKKTPEPEPDADEIEVGDAVTFTDEEGAEQEGEVTEIEGDEYTVAVTTGKGKSKKTEEWALALDDLTKVVE